MQKQHGMLKFVSIVLFILLLGFGQCILADAAPDWYPREGALRPNHKTNIVLSHHKIIFDTRATQITSTYSLKNTGAAQEVISVSFPVCMDNYGGLKDKPNFCDLQRDSLKVVIDGKNAPLEVLDTYDSDWGAEELSYAFKIDFPPGTNREVTVVYQPVSLDSWDFPLHDPYTHYSHLLNTRHLWQSSDGPLDIVVLSPNIIAHHNVLVAPIAGKPFKITQNRAVLTVNMNDVKDDSLRIAVMSRSELEIRATLRQQFASSPKDAQIAIAHAHHTAIGVPRETYESLMNEAIKLLYPDWSEQRRTLITRYYYYLLRSPEEYYEKGILAEHEEQMCREMGTLQRLHAAACMGDKKCLQYVALLAETYCYDFPINDPYGPSHGTDTAANNNDSETDSNEAAKPIDARLSDKHQNTVVDSSPNTDKAVDSLRKTAKSTTGRTDSMQPQINHWKPVDETIGSKQLLFIVSGLILLAAVLLLLIRKRM